MTIPEQRNLGVAEAIGDVDRLHRLWVRPRARAGCRACSPRSSTVARQVTCGRTGSRGRSVYDGTPDGVAHSEQAVPPPEHVEECPTINMAFRREAFERVGGFDESFQYGSDIDFSWRLTRAGTRIRYVPDAVVVHDWGDSPPPDPTRAVAYGRARAHLYRKHPDRIVAMLRKDPIVAAYPLVPPRPPAHRASGVPTRCCSLSRSGGTVGSSPCGSSSITCGSASACSASSVTPSRAEVPPRVKVLVLPRDENPYQGSLYGAMDRRDVEVQYLDGPTSSQTAEPARAPVPARSGTGHAGSVCCTSTGSTRSWSRGRVANRTRGVVQRGFELFLALARRARVPDRVDRAQPRCRTSRCSVTIAAARRALVARSDAVIAHSRHTAAEVAGVGARRGSS